MASPLQRKLAAVLYADVAGYSRLTAEDEDGTHRRLSDALDLIAALVSARRGRVVHYAGDAVLADFTTATDALGSAVLIQKTLNTKSAGLPEDRRLVFRVGLNLGEVIDDRGDVYGDGVNIAARLEALAEPGGICVSEAMRAAVGKRLALDFEDIGPQDLKNIPEPVQAFRVKQPELGEGETRDYEAVVLRAEARAYQVLMSETGNGATRPTLDRARAVIIATLESHGARIGETPGDTVVATFDDAASGVAGAQAAREAMSQLNADLDAAERVHYRFGLAMGEVTEGPSGLGGDAVERARELAAHADADGIRLTDAVAEQLPEDEALSAVEAGVYALLFDVPPAASGPPALEALDIPLPDKPSIVVLSFTCVGDDAEAQDLAEGIRIDIQNALVKIAELMVMAAGTVEAFRGVTGEEAAPRLGVRYALEGTVRRAGDRVRVNAQLNDVANNAVVWSERYDRVLDDAFVLQDDIVERVVTALDVKLSSGEQGRVWRKCLTDPKAREIFYAGLRAFFRMNAESMTQAKAGFERVAQMAPESAMGPTWVTLCLWFEATRGWAADPDAARAEAGMWSERACAMQDADGMAHSVLANVRLLERRHDEALTIAREAVEIRPGCTNANGFLGNVLLHCDDYDDAIVHVKRAIRLSPVYPPWFLEILSAAYREAGQVDLSITAAREVMRVQPQTLHGRLLLTCGLARGGWLAEARQIAREVVELDKHFALQRYAQTQPYRTQSVIDRVVDDLRAAGLPE